MTTAGADVASLAYPTLPLGKRSVAVVLAACKPADKGTTFLLNESWTARSNFQQQVDS